MTSQTPEMSRRAPENVRAPRARVRQIFPLARGGHAHLRAPPCANWAAVVASRRPREKAASAARPDQRGLAPASKEMEKAAQLPVGVAARGEQLDGGHALEVAR